MSMAVPFGFDSKLKSPKLPGNTADVLKGNEGRIEVVGA